MKKSGTVAKRGGCGAEDFTAGGAPGTEVRTAYQELQDLPSGSGEKAAMQVAFAEEILCRGATVLVRVGAGSWTTQDCFEVYNLHLLLV